MVPSPPGAVSAPECDIGRKLAPLFERIETLRKMKGISKENTARLADLAESAHHLRRRVMKKLADLSDEKKMEYVENALASYTEAVRQAEESMAKNTPPERKKYMDGLVLDLENLEKRADFLVKSTLARDAETKRLAEIKKKMLSLRADLLDTFKRSSLDLSVATANVEDATKIITACESHITKRKHLRRIGAPHYRHHIFDKFSLEKIVAVHKKWRKKPVGELAKELSIGEEETIALARALGWPVMPESLNWWQKNFTGLRIGDAVDVTNWTEGGLKPLRQTNSEILNEALAEKCRIYAIPVYGGRGGFNKWSLGEDGAVEVDSAGAHEISVSPRIIVAAFVCAVGQRNTRYIGYDEISHGTDGSLEGFPAKTAHGLHKYLGLGSDDTYLLLLRKPEEVAQDISELKRKLKDVMEQGENAKIPVHAAEGEDEYAAIRRQSHYLLKDDVAEFAYHRRHEER